MLGQIQAIRNWTNPQHSGLLPWPDDMLHQLWFQKPLHDDDFSKKIQHSFNVCLTADSLMPLRDAAVEQKKAMDDFKLSMAHNFKNMLDDLRKQQGKLDKKAKPVDLTEVWFRGIANRVHADFKSKSSSEIQSLLSAYHEFEQSKLKTALLIPEYNALSRKNQNDIIDAEQLVYLGDPSLIELSSECLEVDLTEINVVGRRCSRFNHVALRGDGVAAVSKTAESSNLRRPIRPQSWVYPTPDRGHRATTKTS